MHVPLSEVGQGFGNLVLLFKAAVLAAPPGIKSMAQGAVGQVGQGTLGFTLLVP